MEKLTLSDIASVLEKKNKLSSAEAESFVTAIFELIREGLESDQLVKVRGLGTFKIIGVESRESVNVNTGERVLINGHSKITFTPDNTMKELVNKPFSQFETVPLNDGVEFEDMVEEENREQASSDVSTLSVADSQELSSPEPSVVSYVPTISDKTPITSEEAPITSEEAPITSEEAPITSEETPETSEKALILSDNSPITGDKVPATAAPSISAPQRSILERAGILESATDAVRMDDSQAETEPYAIQDEAPADAGSAHAEESVQSDEEVVEEESDTVVESAPFEEEEEKAEEEFTHADEEAVEEGADSVEEEEVVDEEEESSGSQTWKWLLFSVLSLVLIVLAALGGYYYGVQETTAYYLQREGRGADAEWVEEKDSVKMVEAKRDTVKAVMAKKDTVVLAKPDSSKAVAPSAATGNNTQELSVDYGAKDVRVRTGAYRIVGLDCVETVRAGETLSRLSRRTLGEGMECYIEVYNDIQASTPLRQGQKIKIPKLQWKKKR